MLYPFRRRPEKKAVARAKFREAETAQADPVVLSLAIWLGLVVAATGVSRVVQDAMAQARAAQAAAAASGRAIVAPQPMPLAGALPGAFALAPMGG